MNDEIAEIHQNPSERPFPLRAEGLKPVFGKDILDVIPNGPELLLRIRRTNKEVVGYGRDASHLENNQIVRFFIESGPCREKGFLS